MRWRQRQGVAGFGVLAVVLVSMTMLTAAAEESVPPLPPPRPDTPAVPSAPAEPQATKVEAPKSDGCVENLTAMGVRFETRPAIQENSCTVENPVMVSSLPGDVALSPSSLMTCGTAESLVRWIKEIVVPEADRQLKAKPTKLLIGTSYQCRSQRSGGKMSEHATGQALDIMGLEFGTRAPLAIAFQTKGSTEEAFQSAIQKGACPIFTTVLGPGADADHADHLHVDMRVRKGDFRICQ